MRYLSLFSGIEAASVAWGPLGWECAAVAEIEPFACAVLNHRYPDVPNLGDVTKANYDSVGPIDLAVFGSPCQSFSVAGKRLGMDDPRGNLALYALSVVNRLRPRWFVFENVPGLLSSAGGRDFGQFLGAVGDCGYQCAWRVLDAQHFGVPQRRRRLFVVGHPGDWRPPAAVLFERESLLGHITPRRKTQKDAAATPGESTENCVYRVHGEHSTAMTGNGVANVADPADTVRCLDTCGGYASNQGGNVVLAFSCKDYGADAGTTSPTLRAMSNSDSNANAGGQVAITFADKKQELRVRRLTPEECEKLMGLPEGWTNVPYRGKPTAKDGPRYKAIGNSMAVPVVRWVGERIDQFSKLYPS